MVSACGGEVEGTASDKGGDNDRRWEYSHVGKGSRGMVGCEVGQSKMRLKVKEV